jgi:D-glycero-D-manno-heptose 1,7-bisphosphate phosphatase
MLNKIHEKLKVYLKKNKTSIDKIYFCPHTPFENCECRKPNPGLIMQAINDFNIDISKSIMVGDSNTDIEAAESVGCKGILLNKNQSLLEIVHDLVESEKI